MMIVDDSYIIVGSANINERSMRGTRDTEIAIGSFQENYTCKRGVLPRGRVYGFHKALWVEHLQIMDKMLDDPSKIKCIQKKHRFASLGSGIASWISEHVLLHPFVVIRRQCQVNHTSTGYHLTPITLIYPMFNIQRQQGFGCLWKGAVSTLVVKAIGYASESTISEITSLPKEVNRNSSLRKIAEHLFLKSLSCLIITPFYAASLVETVKAIEKDIDNPGIMDWLAEGVGRLFSWQSAAGSRQLMLLKLLFPTVLFGVSHYVISSLAQYNVALLVKNEIAEVKERDRQVDVSRSDVNTVYEAYYPELLASFVGHLVADIALFPLETVLHRLYVQGTRTIIDNMDTGLDVIHTPTCYEGPVDCVMSILQTEGVAGFYKGFGALILQYATHQAILRFTRFILERLSASQDNAGPVLGTDYQRMQEMDRAGDYQRLQGADGTDYHRHGMDGSDYRRLQAEEQRSGRQYLSPFPNQSGDSPSFNMDQRYSTSTPYSTPTTGYHGHTGTGVARR